MQVRVALDTPYLIWEEALEQRTEVQEAALCQLHEMELPALEDGRVVAEMELLESLYRKGRKMRLGNSIPGGLLRVTFPCEKGPVGIELR